MKQNFKQLKSKAIWIDNISNGFAVFGVISAVLGVLGVSLANISNVWGVICITIAIILVSYTIAVMWSWWNIKNSITLKIRGMSVTIRQGDIFQENGWKLIGVDDTFSISEDDKIISHSSLHGKLIKRLKHNNELDKFKNEIDKDTREISLGCVKTYKDYILLAWSHLNSDNEAHIKNDNYESILRKMWQEIGRVYSGRNIVLPVLGDGITRFDGVSVKPSTQDLLKCMLCTLRTSTVQLNVPITIVIYEDVNKIKLYDLKKLNS